MGTRYVSTPNIIIDADPAVALEYPSGKELTGKYGQTESGTYWGDLQFTVVDESEFTVKDGSTPLEPDENGVYTIKADMDEGIKHEIVIMDAGNNRTAYINEIRMNTLDRRDNPSALNLPNGANLEESLPKTVRILTARDSSMFTNIPVIWEIPETYEQASKREQSFTVNGTLDLSGTDIVVLPEQESLQTVTVEVTVAGAPQYRVTATSSENGTVTVTNFAKTAEDGTPLFCKDEFVMLSIAPDEGYMLSALSINGTPAAVAVGEDTYTFAQPEEDVTITATFEKRNEHTVTFDANGGSEPEDLPDEVTTAMPAKKVLHGSEYSLPECEFVAPEGKQFKAWEIDGTEYPVNAPVTVTADITVKALWKDAPPAHEHSYGDWSKDGTSHWHECTDDDCPKKPESIKDKAAHVYTDDADTTCNVCDYDRSVTPPAPTEFIVTFDAGDGTSSVGSMTTTNQKLSSLPSASRSKHSFDGWYIEKNGGTKVTTDTVFHAKTTVYAHWTYTGGGYYYPPVTYYTLRFETGGGSDISSVQGTYNAYIDLTQYVPTWRGHTFTGWYSERSLKNKVSGVYLAKDMTVYAGWRVTTAPQTGDSSVLGLWGISLCTSLAGCLALTTWQIRRRREEQSLQSIEK